MSNKLARAVRRWTSTAPIRPDGIYRSAIDALWFVRADGPSTAPTHALYSVSVCVIVQGAKEVAVGDHVLRYREGELLVVGVDLPITGRILEASPERPYLALALDLNPQGLFEAAREIDTLGSDDTSGTHGAEPGVFVGDMDEPTRGAFERIVGLLDTVDAIPSLYPSLERELYYWLLRRPYGESIARMVFPSHHTRRIAAAIYEMKACFPDPIRVSDLAEASKMSASRFHAHFKDVTGMTPLQYYKRLRLLEARRLLITERITAQDAAYAVGYESPSQFSREYARTFGAPPRQDTAEARASNAEICRPSGPTEQ